LLSGFAPFWWTVQKDPFDRFSKSTIGNVEGLLLVLGEPFILNASKL